MKKVKLGQVIAERTLTMKCPGKRDTKVILRIGMPQPYGREDSLCPWQVKGHPSYEKVRYTVGVDALQAILLTIKLIGKIMGDYPRSDGVAFSWLEDKHSGFPIIYWRLTPALRVKSKEMRQQMKERMRASFKEQKGKLRKK